MEDEVQKAAREDALLGRPTVTYQGDPVYFRERLMADTELANQQARAARPAGVGGLAGVVTGCALVALLGGGAWFFSTHTINLSATSIQQPIDQHEIRNVLRMTKVPVVAVDDARCAPVRQSHVERCVYRLLYSEGPLRGPPRRDAPGVRQAVRTDDFEPYNSFWRLTNTSSRKWTRRQAAGQSVLLPG